MIPYKMEHLLSMERVENQPGYRDHPLFETWARGFLGGPGYTIMVDEGVLLCAGMVWIWPGVAEGWLAMSPLMKKYPKTAAISTKQIVEHLFTYFPLRRMHFTPDAENEVNVRFAEWLGFTCEGRLRAYGPFGKDHFMYARVEEGLCL